MNMLGMLVEHRDARVRFSRAGLQTHAADGVRRLMPLNRSLLTAPVWTIVRTCPPPFAPGHINHHQLFNSVPLPEQQPMATIQNQLSWESKGMASAIMLAVASLNVGIKVRSPANSSANSRASTLFIGTGSIPNHDTVSL